MLRSSVVAIPELPMQEVGRIIFFEFRPAQKDRGAKAQCSATLIYFFFTIKLVKEVKTQAAQAACPCQSSAP